MEISLNKKDRAAFTKSLAQLLEEIRFLLASLV